MANKDFDVSIGWTVVAAMAIVAVLVVIFGSWYNISDGNVGVKFKTMGANKGFDYNELPQGFGLKIPFVEKVWEMPFRTQTVGFYGGDEERGQFGAITPKDKNGINYQVDVTIRYRLDPTQVAEFMEQKGRDQGSVEALIATAARADSTRGVFGQYAQEDVPQQRIAIAQEIRDVLQKRLDSEASGKLKAGFISVEAVDIRNVEFNDKIEQRIIEKQTKLQEAQQKEYEKQIATANQEIEIINAERDKQAKILRAEGEAESIKAVAFAKAKGVEAINKAYQDMPASYVYTKAFEAIKETDKMYFGFDSLAGNQLSFLDMNQLMSATKATGQVGQTEE